MRFSRTISLVPVLSVLVLLPLRVTQARDRIPATGSAIAPVVSLEHASMRPGESVTLVACVTNRNESRRQIEPGDALAFEAAGVTLLECEMAPVETRGGGFDAGDWTCSIDASTLRLTYSGPRRTWPRGELACARVQALAPAASTNVLASVEAGTHGAWAPVEPSILFLSVDDAIGSAGPSGPAGPEGPAGPAGPSGAGAVAMATSDWGIVALECEPPDYVPGLDLTILVEEASRIVAMVDAVTNDECMLRTGTGQGFLLLELDGVVALAHAVGDDHDTTSMDLDQAALSWLSDPLVAGPHRLRVLFGHRTAMPPCGSSRTACFGGWPDSDVAARLVALEVRAP